MKVLIIEDELPAQEKLKGLLQEIAPDFKVVDIIDSVATAIAWFKNFKADLVFCDIQLSDGISFDIFEKVDVKTPIIFTTAYNEYALKAFKLNSVDYLLKPIIKSDLENAINRFRERVDVFTYDAEMIKKLLAQIGKPIYQERFLVKTLNQLKYIAVEEIAFCFSEKSLLYIITKANQKYLYDASLDEMSAKLNPKFFFRINRKLMVALQAIDKIHKYSNSRLKVDLFPPYHVDAIVSRERVSDFKEWLNY